MVESCGRLGALQAQGATLLAFPSLVWTRRAV
jgi:hypothetical protein